MAAPISSGADAGGGDNAPTFEKVSAAAVATPFREKIRAIVTERYAGCPPKLVGFLANDDPAARKYAEWTRKACLDDNLAYELRTVQKTDLEDALHSANEDPQVHGIIIYYPVFGAEPSFFGGNMDDYLRDSICPTKDVEGLCHTYRSNLYRNVRYMDDQQTLKCILPCTPLGVLKILEAQALYSPQLPEGGRLAGKTVTVFNRSEVVGRPLAALLANDGATVYSVDIDSIFFMSRGRMLRTECTPEAACRQSDVIVLGVPSKAFKLNPDWVAPNTIVVNVATFKNVDETALQKIHGVRYVPLVGKATVAMLERNLLRLYENYHSAGARARKADEKARQLEQLRQGSADKATLAAPAAPAVPHTPLWSIITLSAFTLAASLASLRMLSMRRV